MKPVKDYYNAVADDYHQQYRRELLETSPEYPANYFRLQILLRRLAEARVGSVYEVGVGEGTPLAVMGSMKLRVAGCDIAEAMVAKARQTFERHNLDPAAIRWGDIQDAVTVADQVGEGFDAVIAAGVLPHVNNDRLAIENMGMFLRPGGRLFVEFRNKLFSLFTFNRYTKEFILDDLLRDVSAEIRESVAKELDKRLATDLPVPARTGGAGKTVGYDAILSKFHNPFELLDLFGSCGYRDVRVHWYHYHPAPPMLEKKLGADFRSAAMALEHEASWRGYFLCSAGVIEATKPG